MLLALLLHLLIFHLLTARDAPSRPESSYIIQQIDACPDVVYYFTRETAANSLDPGTCYLCFCTQDHTAVCWKRDNRRCNKESFHYHGVAKRHTRVRRSPGFADIFFRDASRDIFNLNEKEQCKPFESSFSDDCPPADWCTGCTVCDCDANGRWDCHVLSFCPDDKIKKKAKHKNNIGSMRKIVTKNPVKPTPTKPKPKPNKNNKPSNKGKKKPPPQIKRQGNKSTLAKHIIRKTVPIKRKSESDPRKRGTQIRYKKVPPNKSVTTKEMIIKKNVATHKPIEIKSSKTNLEMEIAQKLMKKVMDNLRKSVAEEVKIMSKTAKQKVDTSKKKNQTVKTKPKKVTKRQIKKTNNKWKPPKKAIKKPMKKPMHKPKEKKQNYRRHKRDVGGEHRKATVITKENSTKYPKPSIPSVTPALSNLLLLNNDNCSHTPARRSLLLENGYYKYVISDEEHTVSDTKPRADAGVTQVNITETVFNLIGTQFPPIISTEGNDVRIKEEIDKSNLSEKDMEDNKVKFTKWTQLKILKEPDSKHKNLVKLITLSNKTITFDDIKNRIHGKNLERKLNFRKLNIIKLINHPKCTVSNCEFHNISNIGKPDKTALDLRGILSNMFKGYIRNNTILPPKRKRKFSFLRYLKRIFNKIFKRKKTPDRLSKHQIIETLCENFGPCIVTKKDRVLINAKLADLDSETRKILKTVKIIKGLLKLIDLSNNDKSNISKHELFRNDIQKLNIILKSSYTKNDKVPFTTTQLTQIEYIKNNTQDFIRTVSKFASLLNEIIAILTKENKTVSKIPNGKSNLLNKNETKGDPFVSLKNLLVRYNLVQNRFMKQMYEQLNNFDNKNNEKQKVSEVKEFNSTVAIEKFSRNIIRNLRKLKHLAQTVSYSKRAKRDIHDGRDDDAIEYLLMMMEYLIKQNHPLDAAPVNDGIDLLIEAIKNAPDIKPIKKKVLEYTPCSTESTTPPHITSYVTTDIMFTEEDNTPENERSSSDDSTRVKLEDSYAKLYDNKETSDVVGDEEKDPEYKNHEDRRVGSDKIDDITEIAFDKKLDENVMPIPENIFETTTFMVNETEISDKVDSEDDVHMERSLAIDNNNLDKPPRSNSESDIIGKKFEVFTGDMDEDTFPSGPTPTTTETEPTSTMVFEYTTKIKKARTKMRHINLESLDSESVDKKSKLEWIEENFGKDIVNFAEKKSMPLVTPEISLPGPVNTTEKSESTISTLTRQLYDEAEKHNKKIKINAEELMLRKQMDLLNSLDYGTEKTELYESDSKDNAEDRYSGDTFSSYFV